MSTADTAVRFDRLRILGRVRPALAVGLIALLAACSATRLAYENSDLWLALKADSYLDLDGEETDRSRDLAKQTLERHRQEELPRWMAGARDLAAALDDGLSADEAACLEDEMLDLLNGSVAILSDYASAVLFDLDAEQISALKAAVAEDDERFRERFVQNDPEERMRGRVERVTGWIEYWTGELLVSQRLWLETAIRDYPSMSEAWADYHSTQRRRLLRNVEDRLSQEEMRAFLYRWWSGTADQSPAFLAAIDRSRAAMQSFAVEFDALLTSYQRRRVQSRLRGVADDLESLLGEESTAAPERRCAAHVMKVGA